MNYFVETDSGVVIYIPILQPIKYVGQNLNLA
jgi:hypothetical protein